jgi:hypothetical protein
MLGDTGSLLAGSPDPYSAGGRVSFERCDSIGFITESRLMTQDIGDTK